ncbi:BUB3-interacting and GLEBS motif-containing protein ZNF207-like [Penaeus indicus]|uniref:BUB3-interacting and GLEBS motif-containing protein ZNF207-like n=1 Tax=Penaeus indicus TaxID=29960 RepID=UPI00300D612B
MRNAKKTPKSERSVHRHLSNEAEQEDVTCALYFMNVRRSDSQFLRLPRRHPRLSSCIVSFSRWLVMMNGSSSEEHPPPPTAPSTATNTKSALTPTAPPPPPHPHTPPAPPPALALHKSHNKFKFRSHHRRYYCVRNNYPTSLVPRNPVRNGLLPVTPQRRDAEYTKGLTPDSPPARPLMPRLNNWYNVNITAMVRHQPECSSGVAPPSGAGNGRGIGPSTEPKGRHGTRASSLASLARPLEPRQLEGPSRKDDQVDGRGWMGEERPQTTGQSSITTATRYNFIIPFISSNINYITTPTTTTGNLLIITAATTIDSCITTTTTTTTTTTSTQTLSLPDTMHHIPPNHHNDHHHNEAKPHPLTLTIIHTLTYHHRHHHRHNQTPPGPPLPQSTHSSSANLQRRLEPPRPRPPERQAGHHAKLYSAITSFVQDIIPEKNPKKSAIRPTAPTITCAHNIAHNFLTTASSGIASTEPSRGGAATRPRQQTSSLASNGVSIN